MPYFLKNIHMLAGLAQGDVITSNYHLQPRQITNQFVMTTSLTLMQERLSADQSVNLVYFTEARNK